MSSAWLLVSNFIDSSSDRLPCTRLNINVLVGEGLNGYERAVS